MRTGTMLLLGGAASLAIAVVGTFSTVRAGTVERVDRGGYFTCVRAGLNVGPDNADQPWQCIPPVAAAAGIEEPEPEPEPGCGNGHGHHGKPHGHGHGRGKRDRFASR